MIFAYRAAQRKHGESSGSGMLFDCMEGLNIPVVKLMLSRRCSGLPGLRWL